MKIEVGKENIIISDFNETEALKIAIKIEKDGVKAYKDAATKVKDERLKKTFLRLMEDEEEHLRLFSSMHNELLKSKGIDPDDVDVEENLFNYADSGIFGGIENMPNIKSAGGIVKLAMEVEMKTMLFYSEVYKIAGNQQGKQKIKKIIDEEKMHYNILKSWEGVCE